MRSTTNFEKTDKRQQLLEVAETLFARHGFEAVSIRQLAKEADVNVAMVSYYFGSKDGLFEAVLAEKFPKTRERLQLLAADTQLSPWEKLASTIDIYVEKFMNGRNFHRVLMREMSLKQRPQHVKLIAAYMAENQQIIRGFIEEGQVKGQFRYVDTEMTIASVFGTLSSVVNNSNLVTGMNEDNMYTTAQQTRVKDHLKAMLQSHLMVTKAG